MSTMRAAIAALVVIGCAALGARPAAAQDGGTAQAPYLRLEWQFDSARGEYKNACGRVFNDRDVPARHVMVVFDGFDAEGKQVSRRFGEVVGDVPSRAYSIFCLQVKTGAATYRVSMPSVDWGPAGQ